MRLDALAAESARELLDAFLGENPALRPLKRSSQLKTVGALQMFTIIEDAKVMTAFPAVKVQ